MEIGKLYNIIIDTTGDVTNDTIKLEISNLSNYILNNNSEDIDKTILNIEKALSKSIVNNYVPSNIEILEKIGGLNFFGNYAFEEINKILKSQTFNTKKIYDELQKYLEERDNFLIKLNNLNELFSFFDIEVYYPEKETYLGILIPEKFSKNSIPNISKELTKWDRLIKTFKELIGEEIEDTKIDHVNNGSLDFFIENSIEIAKIISTTLLSIITIYKKVSQIRIKREELKELGIPTPEQKTIEKHEKEILTKEIDKISADLIKEFAAKKIETGRLNELKIAVKNQVLYMAKCVDNGIIIEINPPEFKEMEPESPNENDTAIIKKEKNQKINDYKTRMKNLEIIENSMSTIKSIGQLGLDISKYLTYDEDEISKE